MEKKLETKTLEDVFLKNFVSKNLIEYYFLLLVFAHTLFK